MALSILIVPTNRVIAFITISKGELVITFNKFSCFQFPMMSGFPSKLMAAVVLIFFLVGDFPATSASLPCGNNSSFIAITSNMKKKGLIIC